jgi:ClpP class serine protease
MYERILSRLYNTPLLIAESKLDIITSNVTLKLLAGEKPSKFFDSADTAGSSSYVRNNVGVVKVHGSLVAKAGAGDSGYTSYEGIANSVKNMIEARATTLVFSMATYGGEVNGCFGLAEFITSLPKQYGVKTLALVDGPCCSAGYVLASATQYIIATNSSEIGSIGVLSALFSQVAKDKMDGYDWKVIRSRDDKALGNPHEPLTSKLELSVFDRVMEIDSLMIGLLTKQRESLSEETINTLNGQTVLGTEALSLGLIDKVIDSYDITLEEIIKTGVVEGYPYTNSFHIPSSIYSMSEKGVIMTLEEAIEKNALLASDLEKVKLEASGAVAKAVAAERNRCNEILESAKVFGMSADIAMKQISAGTDASAVVAMFETVKEVMQMSNPTPVASAVQPTASERMDSAPAKAMSPFESIMQGNAALASLTQ